MTTKKQKLKEAALSLIEGGVSAFIVGSNKRPLGPWKQWQTQNATPADIQKALANPQSGGVAMVCGAGSGGVEVIDFDVDGFYERWVAECGQLATGLPVQQTGGGGYQVAYRRPTPGRNTKLAWEPNEGAEDGRDVAIETRGEGGYVVVPPSDHPSGGTYNYIGQITFAEIPTISDPHADALLLAARKLCRCPVGRRESAKRQSELQAATPQPRFNVNDGRSVIDAWNRSVPIKQMLDRCGYTYDQRSGEYTRPGPGASAGGVSILDGRSYHHSTNDLMNNGHTNDSFELLVQYEYGGDVDSAVHGAATEMNFQDISPPKMDFTAMIANAERKKSNVSNMATKEDSAAQVATFDTLPHHLLEPPGLLGKVCGWINSTANMRQPELALANAIPFMGTVLGKKVRDPNNLRTNFYTLGLGESCAGKNHSRTQLNDLSEVAGMGDRICGEDVTGDTALMRIAGAHPACLLQMDEVGFFFKATGSSTSSHEQKILPTLMKAFTSAHTTLRGKEFSDGDKDPRIDVKEPCINLYGTSVPGKVWDSLTSEQVSDGFLGRVLVFESTNNDPEWVDVGEKAPPKHLADAIASWISFDPPAPDGAGNLERAKPNPMGVPYTTAAAKLLGDFRSRARIERKRLLDSGSAMHPLMGRAAEHASKLALVASADVPHKDMVIGVDAMRWACELVWCITVNVIKRAEDRIANNNQERDVLRVLDAIKAGGANGVSASSLSKSCRSIKAKDRRAIVEDLKEAEQVTEVLNTSTGGRPARWLIAS